MAHADQRLGTSFDDGTFGERRPAASEHGFVALAGRDLESVRKRGVCVACGVGWEQHSRPSLTEFRLVADANVVALVSARVVVAEAARAAS